MAEEGNLECAHAPESALVRIEAKLCKRHCDQVNVSDIADWLLRVRRRVF